MTRLCVLLAAAHIFIGGLLVPSTGFAVAVNFCADWKVEFIDADHDEDHYDSTSPMFVNAKYAHYQVVRKSTGQIVWAGILNSSGCTGYLTLDPNTDYRFRQATKLERSGNRKIYAEPPGASWGPSYWWINTSYRTPSTGTVLRNIRPDWLNAAFNVTAVASRVLGLYSTLEYPSGTVTYIRAEDMPLTEYMTQHQGVSIDTNWDGMGSSIDHSKYKFVIGHELGHRQVDATNAPLDGTYYSGSFTDKCNCNHYGGDPAPYACLQSREDVNFAQKEGWAFFYSAALFNSRATDCGMSYWRTIYTGSTPATAELDDDLPISLNCAGQLKWMRTLCPEVNTGVTQDWIGFYWNLWTVGSYKLSVDEMSLLSKTPKIEECTC